MAKKRARRIDYRTNNPCDQWRTGVCDAIAKTQEQVVFCPAARAQYSPPGECCHHPKFQWRRQLVEMAQAGVKLARYKSKLSDESFVSRLYGSFRKALLKRSTTSRRTSG